MKNDGIEISQNGNLLMYRPQYTVEFVRQAIEAHGLDGLRIWTDPMPSPPEDLSFLRDYSFLHALDVTSVYDYEFEFLAELPHLKRLSVNIEGSKEIDLAQQRELESLVLLWQKRRVKNLDRCVSLRYLSLISFNEADLTSIQSLRTLTELRIKTGSVKALIGIDQLLELQHVRLGNCRFLETVDSIGRLPKLKTLEFDTCPKIVDWETLGSLQSLKYLRITNCKNVSSIKFVGQLRSLERIVLDGNTRVADGDLAPAEALPNSRL